MAISKTVNVNGELITTAVDDPEMPLLYLLRGDPSRGTEAELNVRFAPKATELLRHRELSQRAMYGRRPRCKMNLAFCEAFGCSHVSGLFSRGGLPRCDAAVMAAGPDVIR